MKALLRHPWGLTAGLISLLGLVSVAVHPSGRVKGANRQAVLAGDLHVSAEVARMLKRSCMDCHSNRTVWPWYSYVAPMSWLIEKDVGNGRDHMNFSEWDQYTFKKREELLAEIASVVKNREMPLPQYMLLHHHAKLTDADTDVLYAWARVERRRLKAKPSVVPTSSRDSGGTR